MIAALILLPVRVGVRATRLWLRAVEETVSVTGTAAGRVIELASRGAGRGADGRAGGGVEDQAAADRSPAAGQSAELGSTDRRRQAAEARAAAERALRAVPSAPTPAPPPPPAGEPAHVSEEPTLVEEFAEPGAEEGVGAQIRVDPPWEGYERMTANQITARLSGSSPEELAAVQLYELAHRRRQTIVNAVERQLRKANGRGPHNPQRG